MFFNPLAILVSTLVPLVVGTIWYNQRVFGKAWMEATGMTEEKAKEANMVKILGLSLVFSFFLTLVMHMLTIHQLHFQSVLVNEPGFGKKGSEIMVYIAAYMKRYGSHFRTFKHGAFHGFVASVLLVLPILGTHALYEQRKWKYIAINWGYWAVNFMIMGGIISGWPK